VLLRSSVLAPSITGCTGAEQHPGNAQSLVGVEVHN